MIELYMDGYEAFLNQDTFFAAKKFNEAELIFPQSEWAPIAALMTAYYIMQMITIQMPFII